MVDEYKKFIGVLILVIAAAVSVFVMEKGKPPLPSDLPSVPSVPERKSVLFSL